jgi:hypothetical protein
MKTTAFTVVMVVQYRTGETFRQLYLYSEFKDFPLWSRVKQYCQVNERRGRNALTRTVFSPSDWCTPDVTHFDIFSSIVALGTSCVCCDAVEAHVIKILGSS